MVNAGDFNAQCLRQLLRAPIVVVTDQRVRDKDGGFDAAARNHRQQLAFGIGYALQGHARQLADSVPVVFLPNYSVTVAERLFPAVIRQYLFSSVYRAAAAYSAASVSGRYRQGVVPTRFPPRLRRDARARWAARSVAVAVILLMTAYLGVTAAQVWLAASADGTRKAGAILVLGAAQYDGHPSPALQQRLDHAVALYQDGVAPVVVVTGGYRPGDRFTEATAAASYLHASGVPDTVIRREVQGRNTFEQLAASARFLRAEGIADVVLVSHPMHAHRLELVAREVGLEASVSSTKSRVDLRQGLRETVAVAVGRVIGFRRLSNFTMRPDETA